MRRENPRLRRLTKILGLASAAAFVASFFMKSRLPDPSDVLPVLSQDPVQTGTGLPGPFDVVRKGFTYTVTPVANYELWGMVVSYHHAASFVDIAHEMWKDYVNVKDVCVIWGKNVESGVYERMRFKNRDFTCYYRYPDRETGALFTENGLSNNHLLPAGPAVAARVLKARKGDQIHFKGWLVSYGIKDWPYRRMTSTTRTDRGNGACETVFITEYETLKAANSEWRGLHRISLVLMVLCAVGLLIF